MLNHRLIDPPKKPKKFVKAAIQFLQKHASDKKVFCALSGGIDSSATYILLKEAKIDMIPVFIDHGLMRIIRGIEERDYIKKLFPDVRIIDIRSEFLPKIYGEGDAEKKRKLFKSAYSQIISKVIKEEGCDLLADGTILPDIEESFGVKITDIKETMSVEEERELLKKNIEGFVKSQHNLDIEYDVEATIQPVASLIKDEVRKILDYLKMPQELVYRKAFPGPALSARIIGPVTKENLEFEKKVHDIVESKVEDYYKEKFGRSMIINDEGEQEPFQVFAAVSEDILNKEVTGLVEGRRTYELPLIEKGEWDYERLVKKALSIEGFARIMFELAISPSGRYDVVIRSINSKDARTATVTKLPLALLEDLKNLLLKIPETKTVYFDVTPKPPATIEYV
ncbi:MAG: GMP synthase (glutamine-hydrolyzing) [Promethearchaeota archaeon]|jgi:GMP synthase (glutamine-hydrolysing)